jgi:hypothetical protein
VTIHRRGIGEHVDDCHLRLAIVEVLKEEKGLRLVRIQTRGDIPGERLQPMKGARFDDEVTDEDDRLTHVALPCFEGR